MPFQNSKSRKVNRIANITLLSAGEDRFEICPPGGVVNLTATIAGTPAGNSFEWEQISGSPVTIDDPTALSTFYTVAGGADDKTFRFYVDRNTTSEQFDDITIFGTATSFTRSFLAGTDAETQIGFTLSPVECDDIQGSVDFNVTPPAGNVGQSSASNFFELTWQHPGSAYDGYIVQYQLFENGLLVENVPTVPLDPVQSGATPLGPPVDPLTYTASAPPPPNHYIVAVYNINGVTYQEQSCTKDFSSIDIPKTEVVDDAIRSFFAPTDANFVVGRTTNIVQGPEISDTSSFSASRDSETSINRYTNITEGPETSQLSSFFSGLDSEFTVNRTDPSNIGGN